MIREQGSIVNKENELLSKAMSSLPSSFDTQIDECLEKSKIFGDAVLYLKVDQQGSNKEYKFDVEVKNIARVNTLKQLTPFAQKKTLLVCNKLSPTLASYCENNHLNYIDEAGNARIVCEDLYLWIEGKSLSKNTQKLISGGHTLSVGVMKVIFAILVDINNINLPLRKLASLAGVSLGMSSKAMNYLESQKFIRKSKNIKKIMDLNELTYFWIEQYKTALMPKLEGIRLETPDRGKNIIINDAECWGGEVAADQLTNYLEPEILQLFTFEPISKRISSLKTQPNENGNFWLISAFWGQDLKINTRAKALLAVADLIASGDSRNFEAAELINNDYIQLKTLPKTRI